MTIRFERLAGVVVACFGLAGCAAEYRISETSIQSAPYDTGFKIPPENVLVMKPYSGSIDGVVAVLRVGSSYKPERHERFAKHLLEDLGFRVVYLEEEFKQKIVQERLEVPSTTDLLSLNRLHGEMGDFILVEWAIDFDGYGREQWQNYVVVTDPSVPEKILEVREVGRVWVWFDFDKNITYPIANLLRQFFGVGY